MEAILTKPRAVERAIERACQYAEKNGVPLTLERVAACLGVRRETIRRLAERSEFAGRDEERVCRALREAYLRCNADLIEVMMTKSNTSAVMLARDNFGYDEKGESAAVTEPVVFVGEGEMAP